MKAASSTKQFTDMNDYYAVHAKIYDLTRWTFLFGRSGILDTLHAQLPAAANLLEIGVGTGSNIAKLRQLYPQAKVWGFEVAEQMYQKAVGKFGADKPTVRLIHAPYTLNHAEKLPEMDAVLFSYSLTMMNPYFEEVIEQAHKDLKTGGLIAVCDFHQSRWAGFERWMAVNHVRMQGHLLPALNSRFRQVYLETPRAYGGVWEYLMYVGRKV